VLTGSASASEPATQCPQLHLTALAEGVKSAATIRCRLAAIVDARAKAGVGVRRHGKDRSRGRLGIVRPKETAQRQKAALNRRGKGRRSASPRHPNATIDPVRALERWLEAAAITTGPVFRSLSLRGELQATRLDGRDVARILQRAARRVGVSGDLAAHSLRAGFITAAAEGGGRDRPDRRGQPS